MKIKSISVQNEGFIYCKSKYYSVHDCISTQSWFSFVPGVNKLVGEIDSGCWGVSYLLSMYKYRPNDFILFEKPQAVMNGQLVSLSELSTVSCYMDQLHPLFSSKTSVKKLVTRGLNFNKSNYSCDDIRSVFQIENDRFERPLGEMGNEVFKAMAAIGYSFGKEIFCYPWMSYSRFNSYHENLETLLKILENLELIAIVPTGHST